jgi:AcrR family transcriptional regulator
MAKRTETRLTRRGNEVDRPVVLRKVMEVLSVKGFAKASMSDLTSAAGLDYGRLHRAFGTRDEILRAAIQFCADNEASLAQEPLRVLSSGKEALLSMLEENVRLRRHWPRYSGCLFTFNAFIVPPEEDDLQDFLGQRRRSLAKQIRSRLALSVSEGDLPDGTDCEALANLCLVVLGGLHLRALDGAPMVLLFRSIEIFVDALGFTQGRRASSTRLRTPTKSRGEER